MLLPQEAVLIVANTAGDIDLLGLVLMRISKFLRIANLLLSVQIRETRDWVPARPLAEAERQPPGRGCEDGLHTEGGTGGNSSNIVAAAVI